ncbi:hypothetical protein GF342_03535 [Candidatus Woesearchaeota archaeon]|nr:hypothetical protein [Candidatus Woesearchaeota archaeon]
MCTSMGVTLLLPSCGINYLWQLGALKSLLEQNVKIDRVLGSSGGAWSGIFLGLGAEILDDWISRAPKYYALWQKKNRFRYWRRMTRALHDDSHRVLEEYGFFEKFRPSFEFGIKVVELFPTLKSRIIRVDGRAPENIHRLAVASSTIPFLTGFIAVEESRVFLDGGFSGGFGKVAGDTIALDPYGKLHATFRIVPSKSLPLGLRLGSPFLIPVEEFEALIMQGYHAAKSAMIVRR